MHNIKLIRKDPSYFTKKFNERNVNVDLKILLDLDKKSRELIQKKENLEQEKKIITKKKTCLKCKKEIMMMELHKVVMYVIEDEFTDHHYEHVECPDNFTI